MPESSAPTRVRFLIVAVTSIAAVFMYIDRACLAQMKGDVQTDLNLEDWQMDWIFSAFFWSYALSQVPSGFLGPALGLRRTLTILLFTWSLCTAVCGLTTGFLGLFAARLAVGVSEAGAYPTAAALVKGWFPLSARGRANSFVALGGRLGWAVSYLLTPYLILLSFDWRGVLMLYGFAGAIWAAVFWWIARDSPRRHPWSNAAEAAYPGPPMPPLVAGRGLPDAREALLALAASRNIWLFGLTQFGVNIGWVVLLTKMPAMLVERFHASQDDKGWISAVPAVASIGGMFLGGFIGDACVRRFGLRRGRSWPIGSMLFVASLAYLACTQFENPWSVAVALAIMAVASDIAIPSIWAFAQDVGGRYTGATIGAGNMLGNLGGAVSPILLGFIQREYGWDSMFVSCAACFALAAITALNLNATQPVMREDR